MKTNGRRFATAVTGGYLALTLIAGAVPTTLCVVKNNPGAAEPYDTFANAAADIQTAINYATAGDTVIVSNGVYGTGGVPGWPTGASTLTNRIAISKAITVKAFSDAPADTVIAGNWHEGYPGGPVTNRYGDAAVRCAYLVNGATLSGFTLSNGATRKVSWIYDGYAGGALCQSTAAVISNCVIVGNAANHYGGGVRYGTIYDSEIIGNTVSVQGGGGVSDCTVYNSTIADNFIGASSGGGAYNSTLHGCIVSANTSKYGGGGAHGGTLSNCLVIANTSAGSGGGGGVFGGTLYGCTLAGNQTGAPGGAARDSTLYHCILTNNISNGWGGGGGAGGGTLFNCLLAGNTATGPNLASAPHGGGANGSKLYACTVVGNDARYAGGGLYGGVAVGTISYFNRAPTASETNLNYAAGTVFTNSCTLPDPGGVDTIAADPKFLDPGEGFGRGGHVIGNYRLRGGSPCVDAGLNFAWMTNPADRRSWDLDNKPRIRSAGGTVDMGAWEYVKYGTVMFVR